jgi:GGDEF domain-containing protein
MKTSKHVQANNLEHSELQLSIFVAVTVGVLAIGIVVLMYPVVFSHETPGDRTMRTAFWGFCALCVLLGIYVWDRHATIRRLRREMAEGRRQIAETQRQASVELLKTMPNMNSFQDRLPMEFRRMATTTQKLSIIVINIKFPTERSSPSETASALGDAAKVISRRMREQDSIYILAPACFGVVLPGVDLTNAEGVCARLNEALGDAAGAVRRFDFDLKVVNYPQHATSATELEQAVSEFASADEPVRGLAEQALPSN